MTNAPKFVSQIKAEEWWIEESRRDPSAFIEYVSGKKPAKHMMIWITNILHPTRKRVNLIGPRDSAKAQPLDAKILTPSGWRLMGDMQAGDLVMSPSGSPTQVIGVYPQGDKEIYRVTFTDGTSTECTDDHLWSVRLVGTSLKDEYRTLTLKQIRTEGYTTPAKTHCESDKEKPWLDYRGNARFHIPVTKPLEFEEKVFCVDPYLMGALLGGGSFSGNHSVKFSSIDPEILERVRQNLPEGIQLTTGKRQGGSTNPLVMAVKSLGVAHTRSNNKFIPEGYLWGSVAQRTALLQGLMDTDGMVAGDNPSNPAFTTVSPLLRDGIVALIQSLGGIARVTVKSPFYTYPGERKAGQRAYQVSFKLPEGIEPFFVARKKAEYVPAKYLCSRGIVNIEAVGQKPAQCLKVAEASELYITNSYIVTHNTTTLTYLLTWLISKNPLSTNALISVTATQAETRLRMIKSIIEENQRYRNVFPHITIDYQQSSTQTEFSLVSRENNIPYNVWRSMVAQHGSLKDPTLFVAGNGGGGIIGRRFSGVLLLDDIVDQNYLTVDAQKKVLLFINMTLMPCVMDSCKVVSIGTRWMLDDIYNAFMQNNTWHSIIIPAILHDAEDNHYSYWPEYWPLEKLRRKQEELDDEIVWRTMYLCDPTASADTRFNLDVFYRDLPSPMPQLDKLYISVDLAISTRSRADWTVLSALGVDRDTNVYLLDILRFRADTTAAVNYFTSFYDKVSAMWGGHASAGRVNAMLFEAVGFQATYGVLMNMTRPDIISVPVPIVGSKGDRAELVSQWANLGKLFINQAISEDLLRTLRAEWTNFPKHKHDDTLDSVSLLFQAKVIVMSNARVSRLRLDPEAYLATLREKRRTEGDLPVPGVNEDPTDDPSAVEDGSILWLLNSKRRNSIKNRLDDLH